MLTKENAAGPKSLAAVLEILVVLLATFASLPAHNRQRAASMPMMMDMMVCVVMMMCAEVILLIVICEAFLSRSSSDVSTDFWTPRGSMFIVPNFQPDLRAVRRGGTQLGGCSHLLSFRPPNGAGISFCLAL